MQLKQRHVLLNFHWERTAVGATAHLKWYSTFINIDGPLVKFYEEIAKQKRKRPCRNIRCSSATETGHYYNTRVYCATQLSSLSLALQGAKSWGHARWLYPGRWSPIRVSDVPHIWAHWLPGRVEVSQKLMGRVSRTCRIFPVGGTRATYRSLRTLAKLMINGCSVNSSHMSHSLPRKWKLNSRKKGKGKKPRFSKIKQSAIQISTQSTLSFSHSWPILISI